MLKALSLLLVAMGAWPLADESTAPKVTTVEVIQGGWGDASTEEVHKVLLSVIECIENKSGVTLGVNVRVESRGGPVLLSRRDPDGSFRIRLQIEDRYWGQLIYQFSHEFAHILAGHYKSIGEHFWFDEAVCEAMSFQVLHLLAEKWKHSPPQEGLRNYAPLLSEYADHIASLCSPVEESKMAVWYRDNKEALTKPEQNRSVVRVMSRHLSVWLQREGWLWERIPTLGASGVVVEGVIGDSISGRVRRWLADAKPEQQLFVDQMSRCFSGR